MRAILASVLSVVAAVCMRSWSGQLPLALWLPAGLLLLAAALVHHRHLASQLTARAVLWSNVIVGVLVAGAGHGQERVVALLLAGATIAALLVLGRHGLEAAGARPFAPVAFRRTLLAMMVMALADAQTLLLFGCLVVEHAEPPMASRTGLPFVFGAALLLGMVGLYRLRVWGLLLHAASCGALVAASLGGALPLPPELAWAVAATAAAQLAIAAPLALALCRGRAS